VESALSADRGKERVDLGLYRLQILTARHDGDHFVSRNLGLGEGACAATTVEQREHVAHRIGVVDVVGDEDHGESAEPRLDHEFQHHRGLMDAKGRGGFVEDQHLGAKVYRAGDRYGLPLASR